MPIIARDSGGGDFIQAPGGQHAAVCCDVVDLGEKMTDWGEKHLIRIYWMIGELMEDGRPFIVTARYNLSFHEKARLRQDVESWRGRVFETKEAKAFDVEVLIGVPALLNVVQEPSKKDGNIYSNIKAIGPLPKGMTPPMIPADYQRKCEREGGDYDQSQQTVSPPELNDAPAPDDAWPTQNETSPETVEPPF